MKSQSLPLFKLGNCTLQCRNPLCNISPCICLLIIIIVCSSISDLLCYYPFQSPSNKVLHHNIFIKQKLRFGQVWFGLGRLGRLLPGHICLHLWNGRMVVWPASLLCQFHCRYEYLLSCLICKQISTILQFRIFLYCL